MAVNVGMYGLQQAYPGLVFKLARVRALLAGLQGCALLPAVDIGSCFEGHEGREPAAAKCACSWQLKTSCDAY